MRWLAAVWLLTVPVGVPLSRPGPGRPPADLVPAAPPLQFDRSLESLERNQVITPVERRQLQGALVGTPIDVPRMQQACRSGALSAQECAAGVAVRSGAGRSLAARIAWRQRGDDGLPATFRRGADGRPLPLITVPVSALLEGRGFRLESVFAVTPRPQALLGNGDRRLLFPIIGSAITTSEFGWRLHPVLGNWLMHAGKDLAAPEGTPVVACLLYTSPSPRDLSTSRMPSSA